MGFPIFTIAKLSSQFQVDSSLEVSLEKVMVQAFDPIIITSIKLFESEPQGAFHKHNTLAEVKLSG